MRAGFALLIATLGAGGLISCQEEKGPEAASEDSAKEAGASPPVSHINARTVKLDDASAKRGKVAFATCAGCHGQEAEGRVGMAPSLNSKSFLEAASDAMLFETIAKGRAGTTMVPWEASLGKSGINDVIAHLRTLTKTSPAKLDESPLKGDAAKGERDWRLICSNCHGRTGAGYQESGSGTGIGRKGFLDTVSDGYLRHVIAEGKSGTAMKGFLGTKVTVANMNKDEIEDVIAYLRKNAW